MRVKLQKLAFFFFWKKVAEVLICINMMLKRRDMNFPPDYIVRQKIVFRILSVQGRILFKLDLILPIFVSRDCVNVILAT